MPKHYVVSPRLGRQSYIANFYISTGKRVTRALRTANEDRAKVLAAGLVLLRNAGVKKMEDALLLDGVDPECLALFFSQAAPSKDEYLKISAEVMKLLAKIGSDDGMAAASDVAIEAPDELKDERREAKKILSAIRTQVGALQQTVKTERAARESLERSIVARAAKAAENAPAIAAAAVEFEAHTRGYCFRC